LDCGSPLPLSSASLLAKGRWFDHLKVTVYGPCMATKTISVDLEAYEALSKARLSPKESFSQVIRRARWTDRAKTCDDLLKALPGMPAAPDEVIRRLDEAQSADLPPDSPWS
jgi:predicted CopG family antitoxin